MVTRGPSGLAHVDPVRGVAACRAQRRPFPLIAGERLALMAGKEGPVVVDHPPPGDAAAPEGHDPRSEEHTSELQSRPHLVCRLLLEKKKTITLETSVIYKKNNIKQTP